MLYQLEKTGAGIDEQSEEQARVGAPLPVGVAMIEQTAAAFREYLLAHGMGDYQIFHCPTHGMADLDEYLSALDESAACAPAAALTCGGEPVAFAALEPGKPRTMEAGFLVLRRFEVVLARRFWSDKGAESAQLWLWAAPSAERLRDVHRRIEALRHERGTAVWQVVRGGVPTGERLPRDPRAAEQLLLPPEVSRKLELDVIRFFTDTVAAMYRALGVSYRRGVLLHGPPGNGKTTIIRRIAAELPRIPAMLLRPNGNFNTNHLEAVLDRWRRQAPCIFVIEDLDWLLASVNLSTFLNLIDGVESNMTGGLMLIATTNHPDKLDPAINNRPGRFDVVIEVACPTRELRAEYFRQRLPAMAAELAGNLADRTDRLSFAHLQEILRLAGLLAIHAGRADRSQQDLLDAATEICRSQEQASRGFVAQPEVPFGLTGRRNRQS